MAVSVPSIQRGEWKRRAGGYEWEKYATMDLVSPSIGEDRLGNVEVDCRFLFEECQWGVLRSGAGQHMAGIVHMELVFHQPVDCKLSRAKISLKLDEKDKVLERFLREPLYSPSKCPVQITDFYGPRYILGPSSTSYIRTSFRLEPEINVAGNGGSLGSFERSKEFVHQSQWKFETYRKHGESNVLNWEMTEDDINKYPLGRTTVYTAFAYVHSGQPFLMKLKISGKLHRLSERLKGFPKKVFGGLGTSRDTCVTLIEAYVGPRFSLDEEAKTLNAAMIRKNAREAANTAESAGVDKATAPSPNQKSRSSHHSPTTEFKESTSVPHLDYNEQPGDQPLSDSQSKGHFSDTFHEKSTPSPHDEEECPLEILAEAGQYLLGSPPDQDPLGDDEDESEGSTSASSSTLVDRQGIRLDSKDPEIGKSIGNEDSVENLKSKKIYQTKSRSFPLVWNGLNWVFGVGFLLVSILYAHLIYQVRDMPRELR